MVVNEVFYFGVLIFTVDECFGRSPERTAVVYYAALYFARFPQTVVTGIILKAKIKCHSNTYYSDGAPWQSDIDTGIGFQFAVYKVDGTGIKASP